MWISVHVSSGDIIPCSGSRPCRTASLLAIWIISSWLFLSFCSSFIASSSTLLFSASSCLTDSSVSSIFSLMFQPSCLLRSFKGSSVLSEFSREHCETSPSCLTVIIHKHHDVTPESKSTENRISYEITLWRLMLVVNSNFIRHLCE